jgi:monovalent cation:proton antiporter-2 (CPA2) family protein
MIEAIWLKDLLVVLATAGVVVPLFGRLRFGIVPGFILAGVALGPGGLGRFTGNFPWLASVTFSDPARIAPFAELGVLFLLFLIGLEFSLDRLWAMRRMVLGVGSVQFFASAALIAAGAALTGSTFVVALVAGLALALSSTAIATQVLIESHRFAAPVGRASLGVLLFQDLMVVPIVIVLGLLGGEGVAVPGAVLRAVGLAVAVLALIVFIGRFLVRPLLRLAASTGSRELVVAIALFLAIGCSLLTAGVGLSSALGAFLAGLLLGESEYRHQLEVDIEPFKGLLLGLFFMTVGMSLDLGALSASPLPFLGAVVAVLVVKVAVVFVAARLFHLAAPVGIEAAFLLAGAGEFGLVVFTLAGNDGLLASTERQFLISVGVLAMIAIPALGAAGRYFASLLVARRGERHHGVDTIEDGAFSDHVVIGGFGRVGETIARVLDAEQIAYVAVDLDAELVAQRHKAGHPVFYGDASRSEILEKLGGGRARAFVVTPDAPGAAEGMVRAIRTAWSGTAIHARAVDADHARRLTAAGVTDAVPEALEGSLQLARCVLSRVGLPDDTIDRRLDVQREAEIRRRSDDR